MSDGQKFDEVFEAMCADVIALMRDAYQFQQTQNAFAPIKRSRALTSEGGNRFFVGLSFEPCDGADSMSSRN